MGIAIAVIYLPLYALTSLVALLIGIKTQKKAEYQANAKRPHFYCLAGAIFAIAATLILIWAVPRYSNEWTTFFCRLALTLLGPVTIGLIVLAMSPALADRGRAGMRNFAAGNLYSVVVVPWIALMVATNYTAVVHFPVFHRVCENAKLEMLGGITGVGSIALVPDRMAIVSKTRQTEFRAISRGFLNSYLIDYIEKAPGTDNTADTGLVRMTIEGARVLRGSPGSKRMPDFTEVPVERLTADYTVTSDILHLEDEQSLGIGGSRLVIRRTVDRTVVAYAEYYWDNKTFKACPEEVRSDGFVQGFIANALNIEKAPVH